MKTLPHQFEHGLQLLLVHLHQSFHQFRFLLAIVFGGEQLGVVCHHGSHVVAREVGKPVRQVLDCFFSNQVPVT